MFQYLLCIATVMYRNIHLVIMFDGSVLDFYIKAGNLK